MSVTVVSLRSPSTWPQSEPFYLLFRYLTFLETPWDGADTLASLFEQSAKKNAGNNCLGHRPVIKREEIVDEKSKRNFEKLTLGEYQFQTYQQVRN